MFKLEGKDSFLAIVRINSPMAKVTSKYQVTVPRKIAERYHIRPGDEIEWIPAGEMIRVVPQGMRPGPEDRETRLRLFDQASARIAKRSPGRTTRRSRNRGWKREDLYARGRTR